MSAVSVSDCELVPEYSSVRPFAQFLQSDDSVATASRSAATSGWTSVGGFGGRPRQPG